MKYVIAGLGALLILAWVFNAAGTRAVVPHGSVSLLFDDPPAYPGYEWSREGRTVPRSELTTIAGPDHCSWEEVTMMFIGWPPGTVAGNSTYSRMYVRDPHGVYMDGRFRDLLDRDATLPTDARPTGHELAGVKVYVSPSDQDEALYLVGRDQVERWPRVEPMGLCM